MSNYRRILEPGAQYFFTVNLHNRQQDLLIRHADLFKNIYVNINKRHPFKTIAICILPDHLHCIWQMPAGDNDYHKRWRLIKSAFTRALKKTGHNNKIWQNRYWEQQLRDERDLNNHIDYIHGNPIKHGYVTDLQDWP
ncbi:MAG: transposase [Hellea sp.]